MIPPYRTPRQGRGCCKIAKGRDRDETTLLSGPRSCSTVGTALAGSGCGTVRMTEASRARSGQTSSEKCQFSPRQDDLQSESRFSIRAFHCYCSNPHFGQVQADRIPRCTCNRCWSGRWGTARGRASGGWAGEARWNCEDDAYCSLSSRNSKELETFSVPSTRRAGRDDGRC